MTESAQIIEMESFDPSTTSSHTRVENDSSNLVSLAEEGKWGEVTNILTEKATTYEFITGATDLTGRTILHFACQRSKIRIQIQIKHLKQATKHTS